MAWVDGAVAQLAITFQPVKLCRAWYHSAACARVAAAVALAAAAGVQRMGALPDGLPLGWHLIRGAAVSSPEVWN